MEGFWRVIGGENRKETEGQRKRERSEVEDWELQGQKRQSFRVEKGNTGLRALREKGVFRSKNLGLGFWNYCFAPWVGSFFGKVSFFSSFFWVWGFE